MYGGVVAHAPPIACVNGPSHAHDDADTFQWGLDTVLVEGFSCTNITILSDNFDPTTSSNWASNTGRDEQERLGAAGQCRAGVVVRAGPVCACRHTFRCLRVLGTTGTTCGSNSGNGLYFSSSTGNYSLAGRAQRRGDETPLDEVLT